MIGLDFDNTLVDYGDAFREEAAGFGLSLCGIGKTEIRDALRLRPGGEILWQKLQAQVYGVGLEHARVMPGAAAFIDVCVQRGIALSIVSHKSRYAAQAPEGVDLREVARSWLDRNSIKIPSENVFFEDTREQKLRRIEALGCTHFVDDLADVLIDPGFPSATRRLWLTMVGEPSNPLIDLAGDWFRVAEYVLSGK